MACWCTLLFSIVFSAWAVWITIFIRRIYFTNLKDLVESDVKFYSDFEVAQRYDSINIDLLKYTLCGIFLLPFRLVAFISCVLTEFTCSKILAKIYGGEYLLFLAGLSFNNL